MKNPKVFIALAAAVALAIAMSDDKDEAYAYTSNGDKAVSYAESQEGLIEGSDNVVTQYFGAIGPWCHMFIKYVCDVVGVGENISWSSYCDDQYGFPGGIQYYSSRGEYCDMQYEYHYPDRSDILYLDWDGDHKADHVTFVTGADDTYVYTIEGNADDRVQSRYYPLDSPCIVGYATPDYGDSDEDYYEAEETVSFEPEEEYVPDEEIEETTYPDVTYEEAPAGGQACISSSVGAWLRSEMNFSEGSKIGVIDTYQNIEIIETYGDWIYAGAYLDGCYTYGYIHRSTISYNGSETDFPVSSQGSVSSSIGCNFRSSPEFDDSNIIAVLDTDEIVEIESEYGEWAFAKAYVNGYYLYGYIHLSVLTR